MISYYLPRVVFIIALLMGASATEAFLAVPNGRADPPEPTNSYYWPEAGSVANPILGSAAVANFRMCPNNDGGSSLFNNARIKIHVRDVHSNGVPGVSASDICIIFNGGTVAQGYPASGIGADSIIANSQWNQSPLCPNVQLVCADGPTDSEGYTYITFAGSTPGNRGVTTRDPSRKWGHYDSNLRVFVLGQAISGKLTPTSAIGSYQLRIKSFDHVGGLLAEMNNGEWVSPEDFNAIANNIGVNDALSYWRDFNSDGVVDGIDLNMITQHQTHDCDSPNNP